MLVTVSPSFMERSVCAFKVFITGVLFTFKNIFRKRYVLFSLDYSLWNLYESKPLMKHVPSALPAELGPLLLNSPVSALPTL